MNSDIDDFLDHVDQWKFTLHDTLDPMTATQRRAFWKQIHEKAHTRGLPVDRKKPAKRVRSRPRRTA